MFSALRAMLRSPEGKVIVVWATAHIVLGTLMYMWLEGWSPVDALYFSVVTLATVGFGDLHPTSAVSKLFTVLYILFGLGVLAAFISELTKQRAAVFGRLRSHDNAAEKDAGRGTQGPEQTQPGTNEEGEI